MQAKTILKVLLADLYERFQMVERHAGYNREDAEYQSYQQGKLEAYKDIEGLLGDYLEELETP